MWEVLEVGMAGSTLGRIWSVRGREDFLQAPKDVLELTELRHGDPAPPSEFALTVLPALFEY